MNIKYLLLVLSLMLYSCYEITSEEFSMSPIPYLGSIIKLDGYYYTFSSEYNIYSNYIFYSNGVVLKFDYTSKIVDFYSNDKYIESVKKDKSNWGLYTVKNDTITIQYKILIDYKYKVYSMQSKILNDTTLSFGDSKYHFKKLSSKPDSINIFIK